MNNNSERINERFANKEASGLKKKVINFLNPEIEDLAKSLSYIQRVKYDIANTFKLRKFEKSSTFIPKITKKIHIPNNPLYYDYREIKNDYFKERFEKLYPGKDIEVGDKIIEIHLKYLDSKTGEKIQITTEKLKKWVAELQKNLQSDNKNCKYVVGTSYIAKAMRMFGGEVIELGNQVYETGIYKNVLSPKNKHMKLERFLRKRNSVKMEIQDSIIDNTDPLKIKNAIISYDDFMKIDLTSTH